MPMKFAKIKISSLAEGADLTTRFAIHSFICIGIMAVALWFIASHYMISEILDREWDSTAQFVRTEVKEFLTAEDFKTKDRKSVGHKFEQLLGHVTQMPNIVRFKVYNPKGVVIWSDDKRLVGKSFPSNKELRGAIGGNIVADVRSLNKVQDFTSDGVERGVEVYIPVYSDNPRELLGVFEIYKKADSIYREILDARIAVLLGTLAGGVLLYLSLLVIVRQAGKKIEEQQADLVRMQSELVSSQRMAAVGEMAAAVAHGIGNPLSSIRAAAQVAMLDCGSRNGDEPRAQAMDSLQSIIQQVDRVKKRMQALLNFSKPLDPHPVPVEVNGLVREVVETLRPRFNEAKVAPDCDLDPNLPNASLDPNHLEQALMGVIANAIEATPQGGKVAIRTKAFGNGESKKSVNVSIEDTGEGIPVENRKQIFVPFFTTKPHGTGMGLALAKKFVEKNGGTISVEQRSSGGTIVELNLPSNGVGV
jgi:two-component system, NtrC family, sensor histidine kinase HydH